ncbi:MAG: proteobacterial dedicated sortase system histidine kinase, partial [Gammaproteobacteria bacterium]
MKLRNQLIILSLLTLTLPWAGCEYIREMENTLRQTQAQSLLNSIKTIARITAEDNAAFFEQHQKKLTTPMTNNLYAFQLKNEPILDGYVDDWGYLAEELRQFPNQKEKVDITDNAQVALVAATYKNHLYLFLQVQDNRVIYNDPRQQRVNNDQLRLHIRHNQQQSIEYLIETSAPGKVIAEHAVATPFSESVLRKRNDIYGQWQDTSEGYNIELRIPLKLINPNINLAILDYDHSDQNEPAGWYGSLDLQTSSSNGHLIQAEDHIHKLLTKFRQDNSRFRITDSQGWLLASTDLPTTELTNISELKLDETLQAMLYQFYSLIMYWSESRQQPYMMQYGRLSGELVDRALQDRGMTSWYKPGTVNHAIVSASYPIKLNNVIVGTVNAEQTSDAILSMTNHALNRLILLSFFTIVIATVILLGYATLLSFRIRHLRNATDNIISNDGKLSAEFHASRAQDELGDLSRSFFQMHLRLNEYTQYLQSLASKLSHELRTPLAIIQSSLDNLSHDTSPESVNTYINRARQGSDRLGKIITAMSEATRVEQALQTSEVVLFDLSPILQSSISAYSDVYPSHHFILQQDAHPCRIKGSPELIVQMLDKLIDNAVDFSPAGSNIAVHSIINNHQLSLSVSNKGPILPDHMQHQLFDSMVSLRSQKSDTPHLGLGLHIVKLIAQAHGGKV